MNGKMLQCLYLNMVFSAFLGWVPKLFGSLRHFLEDPVDVFFRGVRYKPRVHLFWRKHNSKYMSSIEGVFFLKHGVPFCHNQIEKQETMYSLPSNQIGIVLMGKSDVAVIVLNKEKMFTSRFELQTRQFWPQSIQVGVSGFRQYMYLNLDTCMQLKNDSTEFDI